MAKTARCGADFEHDWHAYIEGRDRHVCDGQLRHTTAAQDNATPVAEKE
jgi:hypothetical protein